MTRDALAAALREIEPRWTGDHQPARFRAVADHIETGLSLPEDLTTFLYCVRHFSVSDALRHLASEAYFLRRGI